MSPVPRPDSIRPRTRAGLAAIGATVTLLALTPARAGGVETSDCVFGYGRGAGGNSCTRIWHELGNPYIRGIPQPTGEEDVAEAAARDRLWQARCHPVIRQDMHGVRRYIYSAPGCEYGKYE
jgi:hypothetical protein